MKTLSMLLTGSSIIFGACFYSACSDDKNRLPPLTMDGRNTFGCLVNGNLFTSKAPVGQPGLHAELSTTHQDTVEITIYAGNYSTDQVLTISIYDSPTLEIGKVYNINDSNLQVRYTEYGTAVPCIFENKNNGFVQLTEFNINNGIVAGTFQFNLLSLNCNSNANITEGRFDIGGIIQ